MCIVTLKERKSWAALRDQLGIKPIRKTLCRCSLQWYENVERLEKKSWVTMCMNINVEGSRCRGNPKKTQGMVMVLSYYILHTVSSLNIIKHSLIRHCYSVTFAISHRKWTVFETFNLSHQFFLEHRQSRITTGSLFNLGQSIFTANATFCLNVYYFIYPKF